MLQICVVVRNSSAFCDLVPSVLPTSATFIAFRSSPPPVRGAHRPRPARPWHGLRVKDQQASGIFPAPPYPVRDRPAVPGADAGRHGSALQRVQHGAWATRRSRRRARTLGQSGPRRFRARRGGRRGGEGLDSRRAQRPVERAVERAETVGRDLPAAADLALPVQVRPDPLSVPAEVAGDGRDRPAAIPQCIFLHVLTGRLSHFWMAGCIGRRRRLLSA